MAKATVLKKSTPFETPLDKTLNIQKFGVNNGYPQDVMKIVNASVTGSSCRNMLATFLKGNGFVDKDLDTLIVNGRRETLSDVKDLLLEDFATFNGFAVWVNYNALYKVCEVYHVPFEHVRLESLNPETKRADKVAVYFDWTKEYTSLIKWDANNIDRVHLFDPRPEEINAQVVLAGGWDKYKGQVYYYVGDKSINYPTPIYESTLTDMNTEEGLANISNRNARNRFLVGGVLVEILDASANESKEEEDETTAKVLEQFQGDDEAQKIMHMTANNKEDVPVFVPFQSRNFDKEYTATEASTMDRIGRSFRQPPILRAEKVSTGFTTDLMEDAYKFYNSITEPNRRETMRAICEILRLFYEKPITKLDIIPLSYESKTSLFEKLGAEATAQLFTILDSTLEPASKITRLELIIGLSNDDATKLVNNDSERQ